MARCPGLACPKNTQAVGMDAVVSKDNWFLNSHPCFLSDSSTPLCRAVFSSNNYPYKHEDSYAYILLSTLQA